jgi:uncharacterized protein
MAEHLTTALLLLAAPALWLHRGLACALLSAAVLAGSLAGVVGGLGAAVLLGLAFLAHAYASGNEGARGWTIWAAILFASGALYLHLVPQFEGWRVLGPIRIGEGAPYGKWLSLDKVGAGIILLALALPDQFGKEGWAAMLRGAAPVLVVTPLGIAVPALASGYVALDVTLTPVFLAWAVLNLLTTCLPEEVLFRGIFQKRLVEASVRRGFPAHPAIVLSAGVFGAAHLAGGPVYVVLAWFAGLGYGYAYHFTGRIEAAILCHFAVNAIHFLLFTYPHPA